MAHADLADVWACSVCKRLLNEIVDNDGFRFGHAQRGADHEPVAVRADTIDAIPVCDFCGDHFPGWWIPATDFQASAMGSHIGQSVDDWGACDACVYFVERQDWAGLLDRVMVENEAIKSGLALATYEERFMRVHLAQMYRDLATHMTGPPFPRLTA